MMGQKSLAVMATDSCLSCSLFMLSSILYVWLKCVAGVVPNTPIFYLLILFILLVISVFHKGSFNKKVVEFRLRGFTAPKGFNFNLPSCVISNLIKP